MRGLRWAGVALLVAMGGLAWGDGIFIPRVLTEVKPAIPRQRAFMAFRNGEETLIVESTLSGPAGDYAWVIPLPGTPTKIEKSSAGALTSLETIMAPKIDGKRSPLNNFLILFLAGVAVLALSAPHRIAGGKYRASRLLVEVALLGFLVLGFSTFFPGLGHLRGHAYLDSAPAEASKDAAGGNVRVHAQGDVGAYRYSVVSSVTVEDLMGWLHANQFPVPPDSKPAIEAYVKKGWQFFAAKLRHDGGAQAPHPVRLVFASKQAVYPMALTTSMGSDLLLDLYAAGNGQAETPGMQVWRSSPLTAERMGLSEGRMVGARWTPVSHPALTPDFWEGGTLTRLRGTFPGGRMSDDLAIKFQPLREEYVREFKTYESARDDATLWAAIAFGASLIALAAIVIDKRPTPGPMWTSFGIAVVLGLGVGWGAYVRTDRLPTEWKTVSSREFFSFEPISPEDVIREARTDRRLGFANTIEKAVRAALRRPIGDVPGGATVERTRLGFRVTQYDAVASPSSFEIPMKAIEKQPPAKEPNG